MMISSGSRKPMSAPYGGLTDVSRYVDARNVILHSSEWECPTFKTLTVCPLRTLCALQAHKNPDRQNLFGIVQGGLDTSPGGMREVRQSIAQIISNYSVLRVNVNSLSRIMVVCSVWYMGVGAIFKFAEHCFRLLRIVQRCLQGMIERDMPGYAIGGLAGGESKDAFWRVVAQVCIYH